MRLIALVAVAGCGGGDVPAVHGLTAIVPASAAHPLDPAVSRYTSTHVNVTGTHDRPKPDVFRDVYTLRRAGAVAVLTTQSYRLDRGHWLSDAAPSREVFAVTWHGDRMWLSGSGALRGLECVSSEVPAYELGSVYGMRCGGSVGGIQQSSGERRNVQAWRCGVSIDAMKSAETNAGAVGIDLSGTGSSLEPLEFGVGVDLEQVTGTCCVDTDVCFPGSALRVTSIRSD